MGGGLVYKNKLPKLDMLYFRWTWYSEMIESLSVRERNSENIE
jgi:hypothetical protein